MRINWPTMKECSLVAVVVVIVGVPITLAATGDYDRVEDRRPIAERQAEAFGEAMRGGDDVHFVCSPPGADDWTRCSMRIAVGGIFSESQQVFAIECNRHLRVNAGACRVMQGSPAR